MTIRAAAVIGLVFALAGCSSVGRDGTFSGDLAVGRVKRTPAYRDLTSDIRGNIRVDVDATDPGLATVAVYEAGRGEEVLLATFRALPDGRVYVWDFDRNDWRIAGVFE